MPEQQQPTPKPVEPVAFRGNVREEQEHLRTLQNVAKADEAAAKLKQEKKD